VDLRFARKMYEGSVFRSSARAPPSKN